MLSFFVKRITNACSGHLNVLSLSTAITCSTLSFIVNGVISYNQRGTPYPFGTSAVYSCTEGFYLQGDSSRECGGSSVSGIWSGSAPVCIGMLSLLY